MMARRMKMIRPEVSLSIDLSIAAPWFIQVYSFLEPLKK
jgi:hypothetical protein